MNTETFIKNYWRSVVRQDAEQLRAFLHENAVVRWHNTNEQFTAAEFVRVNCAYPGAWRCEVERIEQAGASVVAIARVYSKEASFHVTTFFKIRDEKILQIDEYWGDDGAPPQWRRELRVGRPIRKP